MTWSVEVLAPAKVNLHLRILARRPDGFHELDTVFQAVGLTDRLRLARTPEAGVRLQVRGADLGPPEQNLVMRAARGFVDRVPVAGGVRIELEKGIPAGAGLGGGSSDAAATIRALESLFEVALSPDGRLALAAELGSDVPFFLGPGGRALGQGRGERLIPLPPLPPAWLVLGLPPVHVATGPAYELLARSRQGTDVGHPPGTGPVSEWYQVARQAVNDFEPVVAAAYPAVARALEAVRVAGPLLALLSGSGGAVFAVHLGRAAAEQAAAEARRAAPDVPFVVAPTLDELPPVTRVAP